MQHFHHQTWPFQWPRRLPLHARAISLHVTVTIAIKAVSLLCSSGSSIIVIVVALKFKCRRNILNNRTATPRRQSRSWVQSKSRTCREHDGREVNATTADGCNDNEKWRLIPLFVGGVLFPVSGTIQVHCLSDQGRSPSSSTFIAASHFLWWQLQEAVLINWWEV